MRLPLAFCFCVMTIHASYSATETKSWPAPRPVPVLPFNTSPDGPPIPSTPPVESDHPTPIALWPAGAPGSEAHQNEPEHISYRQESDIVFPIIFNIHNPSIVPFIPAADKATGAAVIIAPGGGNWFLTIDREGYDLARWLADHGVAAFVLKYRLARDAANLATEQPQPYQADEHPVADAHRAIRLVRARASEWNVLPDRIGIMGFSAGGSIALLASTRFDGGSPDATDAVERQSSRPDFFAPIYTSEFERVAGEISKERTPPAFLLCAHNDRVSEAMAAFFLTLKQAGVNTELHVFSTGGHGFGVRSDRGNSVEQWPDLFLRWLDDRGFLKQP